MNRAIGSWWLAVVKYSAVAKINFFSQFAYSSDVLSTLPRTMLRVWIISQFYTFTYQSTGASGFDGLNLVSLVWCLGFVNAFEESATVPYVSRIIEEEVRTGTVAYSINRPYSYLFFQYVGFLGRTVPNLCINIMGISSVALLVQGVPSSSNAGVASGIFLLFFGLTLNFLMESMIGLAAFWLEDISALARIYNSLVIIFGGAILPLALFPDGIKWIAEMLPFAQLYYSAARLLFDFDYLYFIQFLKLQFFWLIVTWCAAALIWRRATRFVSISGG